MSALQWPNQTARNIFSSNQCAKQWTLQIRSTSRKPKECTSYPKEFITVGQAAIMLAQHRKAEVFVTVATEAKRNFIINTYGSRRIICRLAEDESFASDIMAHTGGKGVDVVLNSLSNKLLHHAVITSRYDTRNKLSFVKLIVDGFTSHRHGNPKLPRVTTERSKPFLSRRTESISGSQEKTKMMMVRPCTSHRNTTL
jgi:hypothetical protein